MDLIGNLIENSTQFTTLATRPIDRLWLSGKYYYFR